MTRCSRITAAPSGCRHARKHLGWALDAAGEAAGAALRLLKAIAQRVSTAEEPRDAVRRLTRGIRQPSPREPGRRMSTIEPLPTSFPLAPADAVLNALPHPVIMVAPDGKIADANVAAETFFEVSVAFLRRHFMGDLVPFGSPLLPLIDQVRTRGAAVNEYKVDLGTPRNPGERLVDLHVAPMPERPDHVVVMLQERTIADKMDRQLTHRGAARSVTALAAMLAHEIKNPLSGIRGAAQLLEQSVERRRPHPDPAHLRRGRPHREAGRPHGSVHRRAAGRARAGQHPWRARTREAARAFRLRAHTSNSSRNTTLRCRRCMPTATSSIQVFLNLVKNAAESIGEDADRWRDPSHHARSGRACACRCRAARRGYRCRWNSACKDNGPGVPDDLLPHLFDPFVTTKPTGSGLGLALVAKIVGDHGGIIECESQPRRTVFPRSFAHLSQGDERPCRDDA